MIPFTETHEIAKLSWTTPAECRLTVADWAEQRLHMSHYFANDHAEQGDRYGQP